MTSTLHGTTTGEDRCKAWRRPMEMAAGAQDTRGLQAHTRKR